MSLHLTSSLPIWHHLTSRYARHPSQGPYSYIPKSAIQSIGLGRATMAQLEHLAASPAFNSALIALDTPPSTFTLQERVMRFIYDHHRLPRPEKPFTTQSWYEKQGYRVFAAAEGMYPWPGEVEEGEEEFLVPSVFLSKSLR